MRPLSIRSYAKINWLLHVGGRRDDGYHELQTIFQSISLHDEIHIREAAAFRFVCDDPSIPADDRNLVMRAVRAFESIARIPPLEIELRKRIPAGGGLGGGSSNAAAILLALSELTGRDVDLPSLALSIGSDVPFFLTGGTAFATGRGEKVEPLPDAPSIPLLLILPEQRVMTAEAYALLRRPAAALAPRITAREAAEIARDPLAHAAELTNDFEEPVFARVPQLRTLKEALLRHGAAWAGMSGSGSTLIGAFRDAAFRDAAQRAIGARVRAVAASTIPRAEAVSVRWE